jgi:uncharacterized protein (TIGR02271 family)
MAKNVICLYTNPSDAQAAIRDVETAGLGGNQVSIIQQPHPELSTTFEQLGLPQEDAAIYLDRVRDGGTVVVVQQLGDEDAPRVADILNRHHSVDIHDQGVASSGMKGTRRTKQEMQTAGTTSSETKQRNLYDGGDMVVPIVQEELHVGKRTVEGGGVRVTTGVEERPVNEQVTLHEEQVHVARRRIDQPLDAAAAAHAFTEGTVEVREHGEEAVVTKEAHVVEEIVINKHATDRAEQITETVRRTNVQVDELPEATRSTETETTATTGQRAMERGGSTLENAAEGGSGTGRTRNDTTRKRKR